MGDGGGGQWWWLQLLGVVVTNSLPQDIHLHLGGDSPGQGPDTGAGVVEGAQDYTMDPNQDLLKKIDELKEKLQKCDQQGSCFKCISQSNY